MGIPYSKEINKAFEELNKAYGQVTPLVAAAYEVLETTKNISLLVAGIQVLNSILLGAILLAMVGLLITMNPDLERERKELVTPTVLTVAGWIGLGKRVVTILVLLVVMISVGGVMLMRRERPAEAVEDEANGEEEEGEKNKDVGEDKENEEVEAEETTEQTEKRGWFGGKKAA